MPAPTFIRVSRDFKIEEATRGMQRCEDRANGFLPHMPEEHAELMAYYRDWQSIAISWASN
jgi:hypothetical protein